jgi:hypothetical protein
LDKKLRITGLLISGIVVCGILAGMIRLNNLFIQHNPVEKNFMVPWLAMRTFLETGDDPYGEISTNRAQMLFYGNPAKPGQDPVKLDQPFAIEILIIPMALIRDYQTARQVWMLLLEVAIIVTAVILINLLQWKIPKFFYVLYCIGAVFGVQSFFPLGDNDPIILIAFLLMVGLAGLRTEMDEVAGVAFTLALFQPAITSPVLLMVLLWVIHNHRWRFFLGGLMSMGFLLLTSFLLLPGWLLPFIRSLRSEIGYGGELSTFTILPDLWPAIGNKVAIILSIVLLIILVSEWRKASKGDFRWLLWAVSLTLAVTPLSGIPTSGNFSILLSLPFTYLLLIFSERIKGKFKWIVISLVLIIIHAGGWLFKLNYGNNNDELLKLIALFVPSFLLMAGLYWIRWWTTRPRTLWKEYLEQDAG